MKEELKRKAEELSAKYQTSNPDFCGVSMDQHEAFLAGFTAACEAFLAGFTAACEELLPRIEELEATGRGMAELSFATASDSADVNSELDRYKKALELCKEQRERYANQLDDCGDWKADDAAIDKILNAEESK